MNAEQVPYKVVSCSATFGVFTQEPLRRLEDAGYSVWLNPYGRVLTKAEILEYAYDADAVIVGNDEFGADVILGRCPALR